MMIVRGVLVVLDYLLAFAVASGSGIQFHMGLMIPPQSLLKLNLEAPSSAVVAPFSPH